MQMIAEGESRSNYSTMGAVRVGKAVATAKRYYRCRFHPDHCPGTNANRSYQIKELRIKKTLFIWHCCGSSICRKQLTQLHPVQESFFTSTFWNLPVAHLPESSATGWGKIISLVHFPLSHVRMLLETWHMKTAQIAMIAVVSLLCLHNWVMC